MKKLLSSLVATACLGSAAAMADTVQVFNTSMVAGTNTWYRTNTYVLNEYVYVEDGEVLVIEPGTVIKGKNTAVVN
ncbi:MAG TPA: T9SS C-terminal target domain-containing protein, partial [Verrucomicrobiae bacterium]